MDQHSKAQIIRKYRQAYKRAWKSEKSRIITIISETTGYCRDHIIRALNRDFDIPRKISRNRKSRYQPIIEPLKKIWAASNFLCGKRLAPFMPTLLKSLKAHNEIKLTDEQEDLLLSVSSATIDRLLVPIRKGTVGNTSTLLI